MANPYNIAVAALVSSGLVATATVTAPAAAGDAVVILLYDGSNPTSGAGISCTDNKGNVYSFLTFSHGGTTVYGATWYCILTTPLVPGDVITYSRSGAAAAIVFTALTTPGYGVLDASYTNQTNGNGPVTTISGATSAMQAGEMNLAIVIANGGSMTPSAGWTLLSPSATNLYSSFQLNAGTPPLTWAGVQPTQFYTSMIVAFAPSSNPFTPQPRNKIMTLQQRPHTIGLSPTEAQGVRITTPVVLTSVLTSASKFGSDATGDLSMEDAEGVINNVQTMFVDASGMAFPGRLYFQETQQTIFISANTQGYYPIAAGSPSHFKWNAFSHAGTDNANVTVSLQFLNVPVDCAIWAAAGS